MCAQVLRGSLLDLMQAIAGLQAVDSSPADGPASQAPTAHQPELNGSVGGSGSEAPASSSSAFVELSMEVDRKGQLHLSPSFEKMQVWLCC